MRDRIARLFAAGRIDVDSVNRAADLGWISHEDAATITA